MDVSAHIDHLDADGTLLAAAVERAGWDAPAPATRWNVRQVVTHVGGVHRWAAANVAACPKQEIDAAGSAVGTGPSDDELLDWFVDGHAALVAALRVAPADLQAFTFLPAPSPLAFWARRQAHETAVHRADVEGAGGSVTPFEVDFAQDGTAEMVQGFAARRSNAIDRHVSLALTPTDAADGWRLTFGGERIVAERASEAQADAIVSGTSSALYLWLWNRPAEVTVTGDGEIAALWHSNVRVRWS